MVHATSPMHDSKVKDKGHSHKSNSSSNNTNNNTIGSSKNRGKVRHSTNDANQASAMSNLSSYSLIDDDHIDDQDAINVGNLIIDLESDLEKEKIENEQANAKTGTCTTTTNANNAPSLSTGTKPSSSTSSACNPTSNPSSKSHLSKSSKQLASSNNNNDINTHLSESNGNSENNGHHGPNRTVFKTTSDERGELKMRITRETKPGKSEHKIITSPNQKSPACSSSDLNFTGSITTGNDNDCDEIMSNDKFEPIPSQSTSISSTKECGTSTSIGTITEPDCLGPCEPGTSVTLEGIVWQETDGGILVVNITWRGKTYVGALLDCTRHDWAPPRLCDSPASDIDSKSHKGVRAKRIVTRSNGIGVDEKNLLQTTGKLRNGKGRRILTSNDLQPCSKRQRESEKNSDNLTEANSEIVCVPTTQTDRTPNPNNDATAAADKEGGAVSPTLIGCKQPNCSKKYRNANGLMYHQAHAHGGENDGQGSISKDTTLPKIDGETLREPQMDLSDDKSDTGLDPPSQEDRSKGHLARDDHSACVVTPPKNLDEKPSDESNWVPNDSGPSIKDQKPSAQRVLSDIERRNSSNHEHNHKSPDPPRHHSEPPNPGSHLPHQNQPQQLHQHQTQQQHLQAPFPPGISQLPHTHIHNHPSKPGLSGSKSNLSNPAQLGPPSSNLAAVSDEGMKPSGTSTGPPPAPHQTNYYFNSALLANSLNPYGLAPYLGKPTPLPMYDPLMPQTSSANAFFSRFMSNIRGVPPPPDSPSRLLSPSMSKGLPPFPPFRPELVGSPLGLPPLGPGGLPQPGPPPPLPPHSLANHMGPNMSPLSNVPPPPMPGGSPHLRMPSQGEPGMMPPMPSHHLMPSGSMNPAVLGIPLGPPTSMSHIMGPGGPQVPSLVDEALAKQFPRRFN